MKKANIFKVPANLEAKEVWSVWIAPIDKKIVGYDDTIGGSFPIYRPFRNNSKRVILPDFYLTEEAAIEALKAEFKTHRAELAKQLDTPRKELCKSKSPVDGKEYVVGYFKDSVRFYEAKTAEDEEFNAKYAYGIEHNGPVNDRYDGELDICWCKQEKDFSAAWVGGVEKVTVFVPQSR